jgi:exodeoxyribonuclease VII large subunit
MPADGTNAGDAEAARSIAELYDEISDALSLAFPRSRPLWVRGEVQKVYESNGHAYIDLVDSDLAGDKAAPVLKVKAWRSMWGATKAELGANGIFLEAGMTVVMRGRIDFYKARAEVSFILDEIDVTALLGRLAKERAALIEALRVEGLLAAQQELAVSEVPLRVGLVGSPGTEGFNDFLGQLDRSNFGFTVSVVRATVQGPEAPEAVSRAIQTLQGVHVDLICVVRGGGSKGDLAAFDSPEIARAIATCPIPVWTGIGHTGDESVADLVANSRHITPTACGQAIVARVQAYWSRIAWAASRISEQALATHATRERENLRRRSQVVDGAARQVRTHERMIAEARRRLATLPLVALSREFSAITFRAERLAPAALIHLDRKSTALRAKRQLLAAYDPARLLERGWSLTTDASGKVIRSIEEVTEGAMITTRLSDGLIASKVTEQAGNG